MCLLCTVKPRLLPCVTLFQYQTRAQDVVCVRNRFNACKALEIKPTFREWDGKGSLVSFVVSLNLHRRHLDDNQRAMVAGKIANLSHGGVRRGDQVANLRLETVSEPQAAEMLNVSPRAVSSAKKILKKATPETIAAVESGKLPVSVATHLRPVKRGLYRVGVRLFFVFSCSASLMRER